MVRMLATIVSLFLMATPSLAQKAGIGAWENSRHTILDWIERTPALGWYYNWRPDHIWSKTRQNRSVEFVPMIHSVAHINKRFVSDLPITALLGFNEPDGQGSHQAALSVKEAVRLWPKLERRGVRLGSPATTSGGTLGPNSWQRQFMNQVEAKGLRVDFMAVHYYSSNASVRDFKIWLKAVHAEYDRPIWVTEFAYIDWNHPSSVTYAQSAAFLEKAILMMDALPFVERHAWFAANPYPWNGRAPRVNLVSDDLKLTPAGQSFDRVLSRLGGQRLSNLSE